MKRFINTVFFCIEYVRFFLNYRRLDETLVVFDIDNTLANTWPTLLSFAGRHSERLLRLEVFSDVKSLLLSYRCRGYRVVIVTARNYGSYFTTKKWLVDNGMGGFALYVVRTPLDKVALIRCVRTRVVFYDDMSYGHESGTVKFYDDEIKLLTGMGNVMYYGYDYLTGLQNESK